MLTLNRLRSALLLTACLSIIGSEGLFSQTGTPYDVAGVWQYRKVDPSGKQPDIVSTLTFTPSGKKPEFVNTQISLFYHVSVEVDGVLATYNWDTREYSYSSGYGRLEQRYGADPVKVTTYFSENSDPTVRFLAGVEWAAPIDLDDNFVWLRGGPSGHSSDPRILPFQENAFYVYFDSTQPGLGPNIGEEDTVFWYYTKWARERFDRIASGGGNQSATGTVEGLVTTDAVTLTERDNAVHSASLSVYLQEQGRVRGKRGYESEEEYQSYIEAMGLKLIAQTEISKDDEGKFVFDEIPAQRILAFTKNRLAYFTIVVEAAETDEMATDGDGDPIPGQTTTLLFAPGRIHNITVGTPKEDVVISLQPFDAIGVKEELIKRLSGLSTVNYKVELEEAKEWVRQIKDGAIDITPKVDEALWRSIWADRSMVGAYVFADQLATLSLDALAALIGDLISDFFPLKNEKLDKAKKRVEAFNKDQTKFFKGKTPTRKAIIRIVDDTAFVKKSANYGHAAVALGLINPRVEAALIKAGLPRAKVKSAMKIWTEVIGVVMAGLKEQSVAGAGKAIFTKIVQEVVKASKPLLVDSVDSFSYAGGTRNHITYATDKSKAWDTSDRDQWLIQRGNTVQAITNMNSTMTDVVTRSEVLATLAGGFGDAETGMQYLGLIVPQAKYAEKFAKVSKYMSNAAAFVEPLVRLNTTLPDNLTVAVTAAFGEQEGAFPYNDLAPKGPVFKQLSLDSFDVNHVLKPDTAPYEAALETVRTNIEADDMGSLGEDTFGEDAGSFYNELHKLGDDLAAHVLQASGFVPNSLAESGNNEAALYVELAALQASMGILQSRESDLGESLSTLLSNVFTEAYTGPNDPEYLIQRSIVLQKIKEVEFALDPINDRVDEIDRLVKIYIQYGNIEPIPAVALELISLTSAVTDEEYVSQSQEGFNIQVRARHMGGDLIPELEAELEVFNPNDAYTILDGTTRSLDLNPGEETILSWQVQYTGELRNDNAIFSVSLSSDADNNQTFNSNTLDVPLLVDPDLWDQDGDLMEDAWEQAKGLDPTRDDSDSDFDEDGASNWVELRYGLDVADPDSDDDGLLDGEEITPGADGFVTDALNEDTDNDDILDPDDPSPTDAAQENPEPAPPEPSVALGNQYTFLSPNAPVAMVDVLNSAEGDLIWAGTSADPDIIQVSPEDEPFEGNGFMIVSMASGAPAELLSGVSTPVSVRDRFGGIPDEQLLEVIITDDEQQRLFQDLPVAGNRSESSWFGRYDRKTHSPWIHHDEHGWLQSHEGQNSIGTAYMWDASLQSWIMTDEQIYPYMYVYKNEPGYTPGWVYYVPGGSPGNREFRTVDGNPIPAFK